VAEHRFETGHNIDFSGISVLDKATGFMDQIRKEVIEISFSPVTLTGMEATPSAAAAGTQ
jgi:hypothetical protein